MRAAGRAVLLLVALLSAVSARAVIETYQFTDPALEQRYQALSSELRCPKCQNQNIADSNAPIAQDLRRLLYQQLEAGASDEQILDYMVARYGDFVRYRPRFAGVAVLLWLAPAILLLGGALLVVLLLRKRGQPPAAPRLSEAERRELDQLLGETERDS